MFRFILARLIQFPLILAIIYLIAFLLVWVAPGDPFAGDRKLDPMARAQLAREFRAETPWQFLGYYPWRIIRYGDFGPSMQYNDWSVNDIMGAALPVSVTLGVFALTLAVFVGVGLGTIAAVSRGKAADWLSLFVTLIGISVPSFVIASVLLVVFAARLHWFPLGGFTGPKNLILPGIALSLLPMAYIARLTRVSMIDVLGSDFVRTARAKGLARPSVIWKHCLRNAILPVLSYLGPAAAAALTGSFVVEQVFNIPGLGQHFVNSVLNRDQTLILGTVVVYSAFVLALNLLVDVLYVFVDPRIQYDRKGT